MVMWNYYNDSLLSVDLEILFVSFESGILKSKEVEGF